MKPEIQAWVDEFVEKDNQGKRLRAMQRAVDCDKAVHAVMQARPGLSYHEAWMRAKAENPELFAGERERGPDPAEAEAVSELASKARALGCDRVV